MTPLLSALPPRIISASTFMPHTLDHLTSARVFPSSLPEIAYNKLLKDYDALKDVTISRIEYVSDGLKVNGLAVLPVDAKEKHPVLIYNRGGSREYGKLTLYTAMRTLVPFARKGYMVFASNYRGNEGGEGTEEFGGREIHDVLNLLDIARSHPSFDGKNAFMIGHSRGGLMTLLAIKNGAAINAAVSIAGIADARPLTNYPLLLENVLKPLVPDFRDNMEKALYDRSPVSWPEKINVPVLLLHGDNDKDVNHSDSVRLNEAMTKAGKISELVIYPTGSHALVRSWDDVLARSMAWLERYKI